MVKLSSFIWSSKEQVYPLEKAADGSTLYCKEIYAGSLPNNGVKLAAHGIASIALGKVHKLSGVAIDTSNLVIPLPSASTSNGYNVVLALTPTDVYIATAQNYSAYTVTKIRIIYAK